MIYPDITTEEWAKRYNLKILERPCAKCGKILKSEIPFAGGEWRGLKSKTHNCGEKYDLKTMILADPKAREEWRQCVSELSNQLDAEGDLKLEVFENESEGE